MNANKVNAGTGQTPSSTSVGDTTTTIIAANTNRTCLYLVNTGNDDCWIACDVAAVLDAGVFLEKKKGGPMLISEDNYTSGAISGICASGKTTTVAYQELAS